jgi:predicted nuclease with TOPRIM domain
VTNGLQALGHFASHRGIRDAIAALRRQLESELTGSDREELRKRLEALEAERRKAKTWSCEILF